MAIFPFFARRLAPLVMLASLPLAAVEVAEAAEYGRVGRIVDLQGDVALYDPEADEWTEAVRNRPLAAGDRLVLQRSARAELRVGSTLLMLGQGADVAVDRLDDDRLGLTLNAGTLALRVASRDQAESTEIRTPEALLRPQRAGQYRIDRDEESTFAATWRGSLEASGHGHLLLIGPGERHEIWFDPRRGGARSRIARMPDDGFADRALARFDAEDAAPEAWRYASPGITGLEELDGHGRWVQHPEYGTVWIPSDVPAGWAPFTDGRWVWMRPWGWTWVDAQPWGFAPSYYGRWVQWRGRWCWWPGVRHARPVFAPGVVAWVGGTHVSVGITFGARPPEAWVPLQPWQPYVPIVAPRPPHHHGRPPYPGYRLPPPSEPISRDGRGPVAGGPDRRHGPPPPAAYGPQGVPVGVVTAPGTAGQPALVARPPMAEAPRGQRPDDGRPGNGRPGNGRPGNGDRDDRSDRGNRDDRPGAGRPPAVRTPLPAQRPGMPPQAATPPAAAAPSIAVTPAPFSAPRPAPRAEAPKPPSPPQPESRPAAPERRDTRADPRQRDKVK